MSKRDTTDTSQKAIEENLKKVYQETLEEDIPDRFVTLLERLRSRENGIDRAITPESDEDTR